MNSQTFIAALHQLEETGDAGPIVALYGDGAEVWNVRLAQPMVGRDGARRFWEEYRDAFGEIHSEFRAIVENDGKAALEWESRGTLKADGSPFRYQGVSIVEWSADAISRFAAYFNPEALTASSPAITAPV